MNKRTLDPLTEYLAMENGALTRKMRKMEEKMQEMRSEHRACELRMLQRHNIQATRIDQLIQAVDDADEAIMDMEGSMQVARAKITEQQDRIIGMKSDYRKLAMELFQERRRSTIYKLKNKSPSKKEEEEETDTE